ncbi:MAG: MBL fold metallo-hydrolase [Candidatus Puniceispirillum sp.]
MRVTLLGCGTSVGVPALGHAGWGACDPNDVRNRRQRCAVLVEVNDHVILVDAGPDIRNQLLPLGLKQIDALLITHTHADHVAGLDDLRAFFWPDRKNIPVYASKPHAEDIMVRFPYLFSKKPDSPSYFVPPLEWRDIQAGMTLEIGGCGIDVLHQEHGNSFSFGFLFDKKFGYSTDVVAMGDDVFAKLHGVPLWIVEALRATPHQAHSHYEQTFDWIERVKPGRAVLTHLGLEADYTALSAICPPCTEPGVDGMVFDL